MEIKKCSRCGVLKNTSEFNRDSSRKFGVDSICRQCRKEYSRVRYLNAIKNTERNSELDYENLRLRNEQYELSKFIGDIANWIRDDREVFPVVEYNKIQYYPSLEFLLDEIFVLKTRIKQLNREIDSIRKAKNNHQAKIDTERVDLQLNETINLTSEELEFLLTPLK